VRVVPAAGISERISANICPGTAISTIRSSCIRAVGFIVNNVVQPTERMVAFDTSAEQQSSRSLQPPMRVKLDVKEEKTLGHAVDEHWYYRSKALALEAMLGRRLFHAVLDVGAGSGVFSKRLLRGEAKSAICIDPAYEEERQELFNGKPICFLREIGRVKCDLILLMDVLEHVDDDVELVRSTLVGAAEHAHVLITVPAFQSLFSAHDIFLEHKRRYTLHQLETVVRAAGLEILSARYFFAFLLPVAATFRLLKRQSEAKSDLKEHSNLINSALYWFHHLELPLFQYNRIGGLSIFCLARIP
jgi:2-polyprenyl-3-methyl-5-hydroxy-6-metoxy-1,4-benzoquinol methylase